MPRRETCGCCAVVDDEALAGLLEEEDGAVDGPAPAPPLPLALPAEAPRLSLDAAATAILGGELAAVPMVNTLEEMRERGCICKVKA